MEIIGLDYCKTIGITISERTLEDIEDEIVEENTGVIGAMIIIKVGIDQEKGHSQATMAIVDQDQGLKLVLIEIG